MENVPEKILKLDPNYVYMTEAKGSEALAAIKSASTGHPVVSTIHADHPERIMTLLQEGMKNE